MAYSGFKLSQTSVYTTTQQNDMRSALTLLLACMFSYSFSQEPYKIFTIDVDNYWIAYDSIRETEDFTKRLELINRLYLDKETDGLHEFRDLRNYNDTSYVEMIAKYPLFLESIRPNMYKLLGQEPIIDSAFKGFKSIYPKLRDAEVYFTVGCFNSGGTIYKNKLLLGAEILAVDSTIDLSEKGLQWLNNLSQTQTIENIGFFVLHELTHTLQKSSSGKMNVLVACLKEGSCDFVAEMATGKPLNTPYRNYGERHLDSVKSAFKEDMFTYDRANWLYNVSKKGEAGDLGYFVGYAICKAYYEQSADKEQAIVDIIELDYGDEKKVVDFLNKSKFLD